MNSKDWRTTTVGVLLAIATSVSLSTDVFSPTVVANAKAIVVLLTALLGWVARDSHPDRPEKPVSEATDAVPATPQKS